MLRKITLLLALLALCLASVSLLQAGQTLPLPGGRATVELLTNGDFEVDGDTNKIPDDWIAKNTELSKSDKMKCEKTEGPIAHSGECAFMFRGNLGGAASNISQTLSDFSTLTDGSTLEFTTYIDPRKGVPGATFGKAQVKFSDGGKLTLKLAIPEGDTRGVEDYVPMTDSAVLALGSATITRVKIKFSYNQSSGKFLIDAASLTVSDGIEETPTATLTETPVGPTATVVPTLEGVQLFGSDTDSSDRFGDSVAISGDTIVVGSLYVAGGGGAYVFTKSEGVWVEQQKLAPDIAAGGNIFGNAVSIEGDIVAIGDTVEKSHGVVYIFTRIGSLWTQQQKLIPSDGANNDRFGSSVILAGNTLMIAAWSKANNQGAVYVFTYNGDSWIEQQKITASDGMPEDKFGYTIGFDGDTLVVGAYGNTNNRGAVYVFTHNGTMWVEQQKLTDSDGTVNDFFGIGVDVDDDTIMIGDITGDSNGGMVYVFNRNGDTWIEQQRLVSSNPASDEGFGTRIALAASTAIITAYVENNYQGGAYIFTYDGTAWIEHYRLNANEGFPNDDFGKSAALELNTVIIGVPEDNVDGVMDRGSAWVFTIP